MASRAWFAADAYEDAGAAAAAALLDACAAGDMARVARLVREGAPVVVRGQFFGETPCEKALEHGHVEVAALLLRAALADDVSDLFWRQQLGAALRSRRPDALELVLGFSPDLNARVPRSDPPVFDAVRLDSVALAKLLVASGADAAARDLTGNSLLHIAAKYNAASALPWLLRSTAAGGDVDAADQLGNTALHYAADGVHVELAALLLRHGADANAANRRLMAPLHFAVDKSRPRLVELLLTTGRADANAQDFQGNTPLIVLTGLSASDLDEYDDDDDDDAEDQHEDDGNQGYVSNEDDDVSSSASHRVAELLIKAGADVDAANFAGVTPLHQAMRRFDTDMMELLIRRGADVNLVNRFGDAPLHQAARLALFPVIWTLLLAKGADPTRADRNGRTPLELVPNERLRMAVAEVVDRAMASRQG